MKFELPKLNYSYDALEPYIDAQTMEIHHSKHHQAYLDKFNAFLEDHSQLEGKSAEEIVAGIDDLGLSDVDKVVVRNHGGGYINHALFWKIMDPTNAQDENLAKEIEEVFGSLDVFKEEFNKAATTQFGSGWAWLVKSKQGKLQVYSTANQDSPLMQGDQPILGLDVWEHAYYLKYQNRRPEYVENWWKVVKSINQ